MSHVDPLGAFLSGQGEDLLLFRALRGGLSSWEKQPEDLAHQGFRQLLCMLEDHYSGKATADPMQKSAYMVVQVAL